MSYEILKIWNKNENIGKNYEGRVIENKQCKYAFSYWNDHGVITQSQITVIIELS